MQDVLPLSLNVKQETLGVPVVTYGETQDFPAFYSPSSGFKVGVYFVLAAFMTCLDSLGFRARGEFMIPLLLPTFFVCHMILDAVSSLRTFSLKLLNGDWA